MGTIVKSSETSEIVGPILVSGILKYEQMFISESLAREWVYGISWRKVRRSWATQLHETESLKQFLKYLLHIRLCDLMILYLPPNRSLVSLTWKVRSYRVHYPPQICPAVSQSARHTPAVQKNVASEEDKQPLSFTLAGGSGLRTCVQTERLLVPYLADCRLLSLSFSLPSLLWK